MSQVTRLLLMTFLLNWQKKKKKKKNEIADCEPTETGHGILV